MTSNNGDDAPRSPVLQEDPKHHNSSDSSVTLGEREHNGFDLEKTLRGIAQQCVLDSTIQFAINS